MPKSSVDPATHETVNCEPHAQFFPFLWQFRSVIGRGSTSFQVPAAVDLSIGSWLRTGHHAHPLDETHLRTLCYLSSARRPRDLRGFLQRQVRFWRYFE